MSGAALSFLLTDFQRGPNVILIQVRLAHHAEANALLLVAY